MENKKSEKRTIIPVWKFLIRKWFIIVISTVLCLGATTVYSFVKIQPVYTAETSIILKMAINDTVTTATNINNVTLARLNLPTVKECIRSSKVADKANEYYNKTNGKEGYNISKGAISINYGESSMIFTISYSDINEKQAHLKLDAVISAAPEILENEIKARNVDLVRVQNVDSVYVSENKARTIILGGIVGIVLGVGLSLLIYLLDNKIRNKEELEELIGTNILAHIEEYKD